MSVNFQSAKLVRILACINQVNENNKILTYINQKDDKQCTRDYTRNPIIQTCKLIILDIVINQFKFYIQHVIMPTQTTALHLLL